MLVAKLRKRDAEATVWPGHGTSSNGNYGEIERSDLPGCSVDGRGELVGTGKRLVD